MISSKLRSAVPTLWICVLTFPIVSAAKVLRAGDTIFALDYTNWSHNLRPIPVDSTQMSPGSVNDWNWCSDSLDSLYKWLEYDSVDFGSFNYQRVFINGGCGMYDCQHKLLFKIDELYGPTCICTLTIVQCGDWLLMKYDPGLIIKPVSGIHNLYVAGYARQPDGTIWGGGIVNLHSFIFAMPSSTRQPAPSRRGGGFELTVMGSALAARMPSPGDYRLAVQRIDGRVIATAAVSNARGALIPLVAARGTYVLTVDGANGLMTRLFTAGR